MARQGKKPEKLLETWRILRKKANDMPGLGPRGVDYPIKFLKACGIANPGVYLTRLERIADNPYIKKHFYATSTLVRIEILRNEELGEDILGNQKEEPAPKPNIAKPEKSMVENTVQAPAPVQNNDVVLLLDYENLRYRLQDAGVTLDFIQLITKARSYGKVILSRAFIPMQTPQDVQFNLRMAGFRIESCPPRKPLGKDTCDQAIEEFVRFCLDHKNIDTFVLVSGDGDFVDILDEIKNNSKKCVVFHYDYGSTSKTLLSRSVNVLNLAEEIQTKPIQLTSPVQQPIQIALPAQPVPATNGTVTNPYNLMLLDLQGMGTITNKNDIRWRFLKAVVLCFRDKYIASEDTHPRRALEDLEREVWLITCRDFHEKLTKDKDCHQALTALRHFTILKSYARPESKETRTYYLFNPNHPLVKSMLNS